LHFDGHRVATAITRFAVRHPNPTFADAIFFDIGALHTIEPNAYATAQQGGVMETTFGIDI
jgi:hypothetical protein